MQRPLSQRYYHGPSVLALALSAFSGILATQNARAVPITYTLSTVASGSLGSNTFNNATVTLTATADTSSIGSYTSPGLSSPNFYFVQDLSCSVFISGLGTANFTSGTLTYVGTLVSVIGIQDGNDILDSQNGAFSDYNLSYNLGPINGTSIQNTSDATGNSFLTDQGYLILNSITTNTVVGFDASGGPSLAVPEAGSTLGLLLLGLSGLAGQVWISKIRQTPRRICVS